VVLGKSISCRTWLVSSAASRVVAVIGQGQAVSARMVVQLPPPSFDPSSIISQVALRSSFAV